MNVLVIGGGGREHALVWKLKQSPNVQKLFCAPGNAGLARDAECVNIAATDISALLKFARENKIDLTVVGPETPLVAGIVEAFENAGLKIVGPRKYAAQLEGSKQFAKDFMQRYKIPTAAHKTFARADHDAALQYVLNHALPVVVKADGLAGGKGVVVAATHDEAAAAINAMFGENIFGDAAATIVVEDFLDGEEASVFALCDGTRYVTFAPAQDHKRIGNNDTGKNTGGMGAFAPARIVNKKILDQVKKEIIEPVLRGMREDGTPYTGFLYCGLMINASGARVVEFNCRMGDPETQVVMPLIDGDFAALCMASAGGTINDTMLAQNEKTAVCVVMAAQGYPDAYQTGKEISGLEKILLMGDAVVFHAGTKLLDGKIVTAGGRVLGVTAIGEDFEETIEVAYELVDMISFDGAYCRNDIGQKGKKYL